MAVHNYKCPNCGFNLAFDPSIKKLRCKQCNSDFEPEEMEALSESAEEAVVAKKEQAEKTQENNDFAQTTHGYHCDNCGAEVITESETASSFCYYCHSPVIFTDKINGKYRPDLIVPFRISKEDAKQKFLEWTKEYKFLAKGFASLEHMEKMTGIYVPFWLAEADADVDILGYGEEVHVSETSTKTYTTYKKFEFERKGIIKLPETKTIASDKVDTDLIYSVESMAKDVAEDFNAAYLAGYFSQRFSIDKKQVLPETNKRLENALENVIRANIKNYSNLHYTRNERQIDITQWQYLLFPIWILTFNFRDKVYVYALNGDTGEFFGELPMDKGRFWKRLILGFIALLLIFGAGGQFLW